jgi:CheY-like chemotaxis protein
MSEELRDSSVPPVPGPASATAEADRKKFERARWAVATIPPTRARGVVVVEDDPDLQWKVARMLTVRGNRVVGTSSGEAALELIRQWPVDLVLVDDQLPGMSGVELDRAIGREHPDIPVVLMSSEGAVPDELGHKLAGVVATITKPFCPDALLELLRSFPKGEPELA